MAILKYPACDDCTHYLCTGDASHLEHYAHGDAMQFEADATIASILKDETNKGYVMESPAIIPILMRTCSFCSEDTAINQAVQVVTGR